MRFLQRGFPPTEKGVPSHRRRTEKGVPSHRRRTEKGVFSHKNLHSLGDEKGLRRFLPIAVKFDCAIEIMNGTQMALRLEHHVKRSSTYSNCVVLVMLWYEGRTRDAMSDEAKRLIAKECYDALMTVTPSILKQCKAHVLDM